MATGQIKTTEELLGQTAERPMVKTTEELMGVKTTEELMRPAQPRASQEIRKKIPWYDNYLGLIRPILGGVQSGTAEGMNALMKLTDKAATFVSKATGMPKGELAKDIARDLEAFAEENRRRGAGGIAGQVAGGIGQAVPHIASIGLMGPAGLAVHGGVLGAAEGGAPGAVAGAATGALTRGALKGLGGLQIPARMGAGAAFGAAATPGDVQERVAGAATIGALGAMGGRPRPHPGAVKVAPRPTPRPVSPRINLAKPKLQRALDKEYQEAVNESIKQLKVQKGVAAKVIKEQEALRAPVRQRELAESIELGKRTGGEAGLAAEMSVFKPQPKLALKPLELPQKHKDLIFDHIKHDPLLTPWENRRARIAFRKITQGELPQEAELTLLTRSLGGDFGKAVADVKQGAAMKRFMYEAINLPRTLMASYDLSMGFRQGIFLAARHPVLFYRANRESIKMFVSEKAFNKSAQEIASRRTYPLMRHKSRVHKRGQGLDLMEIDSTLALREEAFLGSALGERIPLGIGKVVRMSNRAYTGGLNRLRADTFDHLVKQAEKVGRKPFAVKDGVHVEDKLISDLQYFVNAATGRGRLPKFDMMDVQRAASLVNAAFFSPRLMASRLILLNPRTYMPTIKVKGRVLESKLDPIVRKEALQSLIAFVSAGTTVLALAKHAIPGAEVKLDFSSDAGKIKVGKTRLDVWGGFQQYAKALAQVLFGRVTSTKTGKTRKLGEGYKPDTYGTVLWRLLKHKLAPVPGFVIEKIEQRDPWEKLMVSDIAKLAGLDDESAGVKLAESISQRFVPMVLQDLYDIATEDPGVWQFLFGFMGIFGLGVQTYGDEPEYGQKKKKTGVR